MQFNHMHLYVYRTLVAERTSALRERKTVVCMISQGLSQLPVKPLWWSTIERSAADSSTCGCSNAMTLLYSWRCVVRMSSLVEPGRSLLVSRDAWVYRFTSFHVAVCIEVSTAIFVCRSVVTYSVFTVVKCFSCSNKWYGTVSASPFPLSCGGDRGGIALLCYQIPILPFRSFDSAILGGCCRCFCIYSAAWYKQCASIFCDNVPTCTCVYTCTVRSQRH